MMMYIRDTLSLTRHVRPSLERPHFCSEKLRKGIQKEVVVGRLEPATSIEEAKDNCRLRETSDVPIPRIELGTAGFNRAN